MITLTRFDGSEFTVNAEFIQTVESTPDTHIVLFNGTSYVVREPRDEVIRRVLDYRRTVHARPALALVHERED